MSFSSEILNGIKQDLLSPFEYNLVLKNGKILYLDGFDKILSITNAELNFLVKKQRIKIVGENLKIEKLEEFSCVVSGKIEGFYEE